MLCPFGLKLAQPYLVEERRCLLEHFRKIHNLSSFHCIVVGAGPLLYLDIAQRLMKQYIAVDPLVNFFLQDSTRASTNQLTKVITLNKYFDELTLEDLPITNRLFIFIFNVAAYINNFALSINRLGKPGDILFCSTWTDSRKASQVAKKYFSYVKERNILSLTELKETMFRCDLKALLANINHIQGIQVIEKEIMTHYLINI